MLICGAVGLTIGSSWTTAATLGVAFVALAPLLGADPVITAGAVISGAYFGDKMTPLSETTVLVPSMVGGVTVNEHVGAMIWTSGPAIVIAALLFGALGLVMTPAQTTFDTAQAQATLAGEFNITPLNLLPLLLLVVFSVRKVPSFLSIFSCAIFAGVLALFTQTELVKAFVGGDAGPLVTGFKAIEAGDGQRLRVQHRRRADRHPVLARRHVIDAGHGVAGAGRPVLCRDHGARRLPGPAHQSDRRARQVDRAADRGRHRHRVLG